MYKRDEYFVCLFELLLILNFMFSFYKNNWHLERSSVDINVHFHNNISNLKIICNPIG